MPDMNPNYPYLNNRDLTVYPYLKSDPYLTDNDLSSFRCFRGSKAATFTTKKDAVAVIEIVTLTRVAT
jgi:hypothetical protein